MTRHRPVFVPHLVAAQSLVMSAQPLVKAVVFLQAILPILEDLVTSWTFKLELFCTDRWNLRAVAVQLRILHAHAP